MPRALSRRCGERQSVTFINYEGDTEAVRQIRDLRR
jgi:hypothetical protein